MSKWVVAIDSFDSANANLIKPKKNVQLKFRAYANPGPQRPRHQDRRAGTTHPEFNGETQETQLLLLTSGANPLVAAQGFPLPPPGGLPNLLPWRTDLVVNAPAVDVGSATATRRFNGFQARLTTAQNRNSPQIQVLWRRQYDARNYANEKSDYVYPNGVRPKRFRVDIKDAFVGVGSTPANPIYSGSNRFIWCPPGIRSSMVTNNNGPVFGMTAIGCTCRDMMLRGCLEARYGCKHIIAYNLAQATGNLV